MADIRPQDLPELRAEFRNQVAHPRFIGYLLDGSGSSASPEGRELAESLQDMVDETELFHVSASMTELVCAASASLETFTPDRVDLPAPSGVILFDGPLPKPITFEDGCKVALRGVLWASSPEDSKFGIFPVGDAHEAGIPGRLVAYSYMIKMVPFGESLAVKSPVGRVLGDDDILSLLETAWLLMQQPLARTVEVESDRAARKRLRRLGQDPKSVRVIELRRPRSSGDQGDGESNYQHQWIVRGHWRNHWHPKRQVHRPVWIAPHVKGPEGAPMIGGEKVYAWKR